MLFYMKSFNGGPIHSSNTFKMAAGHFELGVLFSHAEDVQLFIYETNYFSIFKRCYSGLRRTHIVYRQGRAKKCSDEASVRCFPYIR